MVSVLFDLISLNNRKGKKQDLLSSGAAQAILFWREIVFFQKYGAISLEFVKKNFYFIFPSGAIGGNMQ